MKNIERQSDLLPDSLRALAGQRAIVAASTGGHLAQAVKWSRILNVDAHFVTFENDQSRSLLSEQRVTFVPYIAPRGYRVALEVAGALDAQRRKFDDRQVVISTGAAIALPAWWLAVRSSMPMHYIESVSRVLGPSATGRLMRRLPGVSTWSQHPYARRGWRDAPSLLGRYRSVTGNPTQDRPLKVLVTLGTIHPYRFDRMVNVVTNVLRPGDDVVWQLGSTTRTDLPGKVYHALSASQMSDEADRADVVFSHAGVGTAVELLDRGIRPILFARSANHAEHVDEHQAQILSFLEARNLAVAGSPSLDRAAILDVAASGIMQEEQ